MTSCHDRPRLWTWLKWISTLFIDNKQKPTNNPKLKRDKNRIKVLGCLFHGNRGTSEDNSVTAWKNIHYIEKIKWIPFELLETYIQWLCGALVGEYLQNQNHTFNKRKHWRIWAQTNVTRRLDFLQHCFPEAFSSPAASWGLRPCLPLSAAPGWCSGGRHRPPSLRPPSPRGRPSRAGSRWPSSPPCPGHRGSLRRFCGSDQRRLLSPLWQQKKQTREDFQTLRCRDVNELNISSKTLAGLWMFVCNVSICPLGFFKKKCIDLQFVKNVFVLHSSTEFVRPWATREAQLISWQFDVDLLPMSIKVEQYITKSDFDRLHWDRWGMTKSVLVL